MAKSLKITSFEQRLDEQNVKSRKVAWFFAGCFALLSLILAGAIFAMLPLKMTDVKVLFVDKNTGYPAEVTSLGKFETEMLKKIDGSEALNKYFAQQYIILHDSYNRYSVRDAYSKVQLFSTASVFSKYRNDLLSPKGYEKQLGEKTLNIRVDSLSPQTTVTPFKDGENGVTMTARVTKTIRKGEKILGKKTGTITMTFGYDISLKMDEKARNMNPFGFTVTSYRFDPDQ